MPVITNYLDVSERTFLESAVFASGIDDLWTSDGTISVDGVNYQDAEYGSLKLTPSSAENYIKYNYYSTTATNPSQYSITLTTDINDFIETFLWVKPTKNCTVYLKTILSQVNFNQNNSTFSFVDPFNQIIGDESSLVIALGASDEPNWNLLRAIPVEIPAEGRWSIQLQFRVVFENLDGALLNISRPTATASRKIFLNAFLANSLEYMPSVFLESDIANFENNEPKYPLARMMEVMLSESENISNKFSQFEYLDRSQGGDPNNLATLSGLIDPRVCDSSYLSWLSQFRGRPILITYQPSTEGVGWEIFELNSSLLNSGDVLGNDATNLGGLPAGIDSFARWQVETGYYGHNAGTIQSMTSAIQRNLTGLKVVSYTESANQIDFTTSQAETFGTVVDDVGSSNSIILSLIEPARPLGMIVTHTLTA